MGVNAELQQIRDLYQRYDKERKEHAVLLANVIRLHGIRCDIGYDRVQFNGNYAHLVKFHTKFRGNVYEILERIGYRAQERDSIVTPFNRRGYGLIRLEKCDTNVSCIGIYSSPSELGIRDTSGVLNIIRKLNDHVGLDTDFEHNITITPQQRQQCIDFLKSCHNVTCVNDFFYTYQAHWIVITKDRVLNHYLLSSVLREVVNGDF